jgi:uncharacterized protein (TIGR00269 family)
VFQKQNGRHLCGTHFTAEVEQRVTDTITTWKMIVPEDRVAVALSGGKDSTALLLLLSRLLSQWENARLVALTIDEGISGYREETIHSAESLTARLGIEHHCISFSELFGDSLDDILKGRETQACSICGIMRKKALVVGAGRIGATKLATGHNLDDEAQSVLMNVFRGDLPRLVRNSGMDSSGRFIPRIKPLSLISEKEIALYLMLNNSWNVLPECPYTRFALRREVRSLLSGFEYRHPGTMLHLIESKQKIERSCKGSVVSEPLKTCRGCGDPSSGEFCQVCYLRCAIDH